VQLIYVVVPLVMAAMSGLGTRAARCFGRAQATRGLQSAGIPAAFPLKPRGASRQVMCGFKTAGIGLLVCMALLDSWVKRSAVGSSEHTFRVAVVAALYVVRTGLMNCTYPLEESLLMDHVPKSARARWKSLDSISVFGWCGSAALGGYLADRYSYSTTFLVTAAIQLAGTALQIPLIFITRKAESPAPRAAEGGGTTAPLHAAPAGPEAAGGGGAGSAGQ